MTDTLGPVERTRRFVVGSLAAGVVHVVVLGLLTLPVTLTAARVSPATGGYAVLSLFSLVVVTSQFSVWNQTANTGTDEHGVAVQSVLLLVTVAYYNAILSVAVVLALGVGTLTVEGSVLVAGTAALYPFYDVWIVDRGVPASLTGVTALLFAGANRVAQFLSERSWEEFRLDVITSQVLPPRRGASR